MIELPLALLGGLLGSAHCIGMCGPLAMTLGAATPRLGVNVQRQLAYSAGRVFTYSCGGAAAAFAGLWAASHSRSLVLSQAWLALAAGGLLVLMGLVTLGLAPRPALRMFGHAPCGAARALKTLLTEPTSSGAFLAGVATGFIPCGLVYAFLLKASSTGSVWLGGATMALFGVGTAPLMVLAGAGASLMSISARARVYRLAAWCVVLAGAITIARGASQLRPDEGSATAPCPFCAPTAEAAAEALPVEASEAQLTAAP